MSLVQTGTLTVPAGLHHGVVESGRLLRIPGTPRRLRWVAVLAGQLARRRCVWPATPAAI